MGQKLIYGVLGLFSTFCYAESHLSGPVLLSCFWVLISKCIEAQWFFLKIISLSNCSSLFYAETDEGIVQEIIDSDVDLEREPWPKVSDNAKNLVRCMLDRNPSTRLTAKQVLGMLNLIPYRCALEYNYAMDHHS